MPGFVDVSNMSDLEIKRLGQIDDADDPRDNPYSYRNLSRRNPYAYRKPMTPKVNINHNADDVWAASAQAFSINGSYIKAHAPGVTQPETNRQLVERLLADTSQITQESRDKGIEIRQYFKGFTFKVLQGKTLNEFNNTAMTIANCEIINSKYDLAVIVSLPATYEKSVKRDDVDRRISFASGGFLGDLDEKVKVEIEIVKQIWSDKWNTYYVTGLTDDDKVVFFAYKKQTNIGDRVTIQGTVKAFRDNSTQLNRVKVI